VFQATTKTSFARKSVVTRSGLEPGTSRTQAPMLLATAAPAWFVFGSTTVLALHYTLLHSCLYCRTDLPFTCRFSRCVWWRFLRVCSYVIL